MKALKVILISLVVLFFVIAAVLVIAIKKFDANNYKAPIIAKISAAVNRSATIDNIVLDFSLQRGVSLNVQNFVIMDSPDFSLGHFLRIKLVRANLDILTLLKTKQISVTDIELVEPQLNLMRKKNGLMNIPVPSPKDPGKAAMRSPISGNWFLKEAEAAEGKQDTGFDFSGFVIESLKIKQGRVKFTDEQEALTHIILAEDIDAHVDHFAFGRFSPFELSLRAFSGAPNVFVNGSLQVDAARQEVHFENVKMKTDLSKIILSRLLESFPEAKGFGLEDSMQGQADVDLSMLIAGSKGLQAMDATGKLTDARIKARHFLYPVENIDGDFQLTEKEIQIKELSMSAASGKISVLGRIGDYLQVPQISIKAQVEGLQVAELAAMKQLPAELAGKLFGRVEASGAGKDPNALMRTTKGTASFELKEGQLRNVNILKAVLSKLTIIPNLYEDIVAGLPDEYKKKLDSPHTILNEAVVAAAFEQGVAQLQNVEASADGFLVKASGSVDATSQLSFDMALYIPAELSGKMIDSVNALSSLTDEQKRIKIPFSRYQGPLSQFRLYPDLESIGKKMVVTQGVSELRKAIYDAVGIKEGEGAQNGPADTGQPAAEPQEEPKPEKVLIDSILKSILK